MNQNTAEEHVLYVASKSNAKAVAGAITGTIQENGSAIVHAIGPAAVNQTIKAVAIARGYLSPKYSRLNCLPYFQEVTLDEEQRTAMKFVIEPA